MSQVDITIRAYFTNESVAKSVIKKLRLAAKEHNHDLTKTINSLHEIENHGDHNILDIDEISRKKNCVIIQAYTGRTEPVVWFAASLANLGAPKIYIREQWDEGGSSYYFLNGRRVNKKNYESGKPEKPLSKKDIEINKHLFLPVGRVQVRATLLSHENFGDIYENTLMKFITNNNETFYYKGKGELLRLLSDDFENITEFHASFERGKLEGKYVSFAKRPTQIGFSFNIEKMSKINPRMYGRPVESLETITKCPYCGSSLRSEKAKQCPTCFKSWRDQ